MGWQTKVDTTVEAVGADVGAAVDKLISLNPAERSALLAALALAGEHIAAAFAEGVQEGGKVQVSIASPAGPGESAQVSVTTAPPAPPPAP